MLKLLIVDDETEICEFLKSFFEERNYTVAIANSGEQAIEQLKKEKPQVVLLDIKMPGMDGIQTLREIKSKNPKSKVIMVTAIETRDKIEECLRLGADNYITKPLSLEYLENDVKEKIESAAKGN
ncbi:MAG: two-component system response regulator [Candidatus Omnitrophica bacterium CG11_big_fil_rev_8_21_14_0_20_45_26]|uniref:Two-component system response regulator n=1 Tax=Candidatus Abzuiibacterium crystallinum TaxID=1974748 RepID=A0A2H0LSL2_9BACT|nr:MAG: two-component system response regulator [Candidatus Omnitrophica bacterium CG11_big_fil_rev_8_21_14_0_20_45_26]PIW64187.1 MAG: two-component system response regulator [Candidatus Omnitrophica bacterium CG12_big_fil_rev_8_21_14_0_65_45_16]